MLDSLSKRRIDEAFKFMRLSSEKQRQFYRKLIDLHKEEEATTFFIRSIAATKEKEKDKEEEIAGLE